MRIFIRRIKQLDSQNSKKFKAVIINNIKYIQIIYFILA